MNEYSKFFTNKGENTLINKIKSIFESRNIYFFDALVGYFYASGYFRVRPYIKDKAKQVRILVGIDIDRLVLSAAKQGVLFNEFSEQSMDDFLNRLKSDIQQAAYDKEVEEGMMGFIEDLVSGKLKMRIHPKRNIHAKIYIFKEEKKHPNGYGFVISGSSNLTVPGMERNFEFNVELRDNVDIEDSSEIFEELWEEGIDINADTVIKSIKKETYLNDSYSPFELYVKFLITYFDNDIEFDTSVFEDLPQGYKRLSYQADAVNDGFHKMMKHGGFFLADVVGLGKTIVGTMVARKFFYANSYPQYRSRILIITPPPIKQGWEDTLADFKFGHHCTIVTNGSLQTIEKPEQFDLVIVDEAHKFRSSTADWYGELQKICKSGTRRAGVEKKVILVSATPLNNKPEDIYNLVSLFQDNKRSTLSVVNLQHFFNKNIKLYKQLLKENEQSKVAEGIDSIYADIREMVIKPLMVRRTRRDLMENEIYRNDLKEQQVNFPTIGKPIKLFYQLDEELDALYDDTVYALSYKLSYNRYQAIKYLINPDIKKKYPNADRIAVQLATIMKTMLVKRLDSSFHAFLSSLERYNAANDAMLEMQKKGRVYIAKDYNVNESIREGREAELLELLEKMQESDSSISICEPSDFGDEFWVGIKEDQAILTILVSRWKQINRDPKFELLLDKLKTELLNEQQNPEQKLVIFSEAKDTTDYLSEKLKEHGYDKVIVVDSTNRKSVMPTVMANFDANYKQEKKDYYNIIIATEVLAEGVNLHRSNTIVNYDTPWNSTRLMQRIGRVNRVGSKAKEIFVYNFFPTTKVEMDIGIEQKARLKLAAFHKALGEDSQIYSEDEVVDTFGLFDNDVEEDKNDEIPYLMWLRQWKSENPKEFKRIANLPERARVARKASEQMEGKSLCFVRQHETDLFALVDGTGTVEELSFLKAAKLLEAPKEEKAVMLPDSHYEQVRTSVQHLQNKVDNLYVENNSISHKASPDEQHAAAYLNKFLQIPMSPEQKTKITIALNAVHNGVYQRLPKQIKMIKANAEKNRLKPSMILSSLIATIDEFKIDASLNASAAEPEKARINGDTPTAIIISETFV